MTQTTKKENKTMKNFLITSEDNELLGTMDLIEGIGEQNTDNRINQINVFFSNLLNDTHHGTLNKFCFLFSAFSLEIKQIDIFNKRNIEVISEDDLSENTIVNIKGDDGCIQFNIIAVDTLRNLSVINQSI